MRESKTVCIISEVPGLKEICEKLAKRSELVREQCIAIFMKAKEEADALTKQLSEGNKEDWDTLRLTIRDQLYHKGYDETKQHITFNLKDDIVKIVDNKLCEQSTEDKQT